MTPEKVAAERLAMVRRFSANMARSQQAEVGWSEIGQDCTAALWHQLHGSPVTNKDTHVLAALRGTGTHALIEQAFRAEDPDGKRYLTETEINADGVLGHCDLYDQVEHVVEDHKTMERDEVVSIRNHGVPRKYRWQVHGYARGMELAGYTPRTVRITAYSIDGSDDIAVWQEPYDPAVVEEALAHRDRIAAMETPPRPQKDALGWCVKFCPFYDPSGEVGCPGLSSGKDAPEITDPLVIEAVAEYASIRDEKKRKDAAKAAFRGAEGRAGKWLVSWVGGKVETEEELDVGELIQAYRFLSGGAPLPSKLVEKTSPRYPRVTAVKS